MDDEYYMRIALEEAKKSFDANLLPVGAVLVEDGKVVGKAQKSESHSYYLDHAEILALRDALKTKQYKPEKDLTLYTTLEPCIMCWGTILQSPVKRVVYAMED